MRHCNTRLSWSFLLVCAFAVVFNQPCIALDNFWTGANSNSWHDVGNWSFMTSPAPLPRIPGDTDAAILGSPANDVVFLAGDSAPINGLAVGNGIHLLTNHSKLTVADAGSAATAITGGGKITVQADTNPLGGAAEFLTDNLLLLTSGELILENGGTALVRGTTTMNGGRILNSGAGGGGEIIFLGDVSMNGSLLHLFGTGDYFSGTNGLTLRAENQSIVGLSKIDLLSGDVFDLRSSSSLDVDGDLRVFQNGALEMDLAFLSVDGNIEVHGGTFQQRGGSFVLSDAGTFDATDGAQVTIESTLLRVEKGQIYTFESDSNLTLNNTLRVGAFESGHLQVRDGATVSHSGAASTTVGADSGGFGSISLSQGAHYSSSTGTFDIRSEGALFVSGGSNPATARINGPLEVRGQVDNTGNLHINAPITIDGGEVLQLAGVMTAQSISFAGTGSFDFQGGRLSVDIYGGDLLNAGGTLAPGDSAGNTAIAGSYTQLSEGTLEIEIGGTGMGTEHDFVDVSGNALLDGELDLRLIAGYWPTATDQFTVLNAGNLLGLFDNISNGNRLDTLDGRGSFQVNYGVGSAFGADQIVLSDFLASTNPADLNMDGFVDGLDLGILLGNWAMNAAPSGGELNRTPPVDGLDLGILLGAWNPPSALAAQQAVPEPVSWVLIFPSIVGITCLRQPAGVQ